MERLNAEVDKHLEEQEDLEDEQWWQEPTRTFEQKVAFDALRGLKEVMGQGHAVETSCYVFKES
ncbi:hypothetical protein CLAFUW4_13182 [Fulvia fulva]|uniref:Uncharacterized protein n=1 Tax=Passalora fulva TaxID=5499 RepID=A0A9Q8PJH8_PASFU|nr:uncharacterized protein CLAFUR5_13039 [Fulvia fulva]KAK4612117.1 hypothetical protein CLAFUR4_13187 [Fulvia fulva]KAK4612508.1 hypothetical protein CLAFUR0_13191 [Fulvia fulva]UJO23608.1 hypothetical protein CLAFUR5_13039 [Fulvia fulva]WPV21042.1 hypothetical protein CLAFUW4_13182 [Fulvia fulva]WPV36254.1 hypothetical protein CLAFUW7_13190 [Fulvia fulva]